MSSEHKSSWVAKVPLWIIAFSLLTIAACLVLLVMRTVVGENPEASASSPETPRPSIARLQPEFERPKRPKPAGGGVASYHASTRERSTTRQPDEFGAGPEGSEITPALVSAGPRRQGPVPAVLNTSRLDFNNGIKGTVHLQGDPPLEQAIDTGNVPCAAANDRPTTTRIFVTDTNGGLADTVVFIANGLPDQVFPVPDDPFELVFTNCQIEPYVSAVLWKEHLVARDATGLTHDLRFTSTSGSSSHKRISSGSSVELPNLNPDVFVRFSCEIHPWEFAYVSIFKHPFFAVTDEHGDFSITNIPPGNYLLQATHRSGQSRPFGQSTKKIKVSRKEVTSIDFEISAPTR